MVGTISVFIQKKCSVIVINLDNWYNQIFSLCVCWCLTTHQPLWIILCRLPEKGIKEIVEEMKERGREGGGMGIKVKKKKK